MWQTVYFAGFWVLLPLTFMAALRWGGWPERTVATMYVIAALCTLLVLTAPDRFNRIEPALMAADIILLIGLAFVAVRSDHWWPACATALQFLSVLAHLGKALNPNLLRLGYQLMEQASSYPTLIVLTFGIVTHRRRTPKAASLR